MSVTNVVKDPDRLLMRITSELDATPERAWQLWADPRQLERWWGPPTYPATVVDHDLAPGGRITYFMTGPEGDKAHGWMQIVTADQPKRLELEDGFADDSGAPNPDMPTMRMTVTLAELGPDRTEMIIETAFPSAAAMEQLLSMGMDEGMSEALGQLDAILAGTPS